MVNNLLCLKTAGFGLIVSKGLSNGDTTMTKVSTKAISECPKSEKTSEIKSDSHIYIYDIIRIVATFFVVINHSIGKVYYDVDLSSVEWYISALLFIICKTAVPLFLMITGTLLLQKNAQSYQIIIKYIIRILIVLFAWSWIYSCYFNNGILSIAETKTMIINAITKKPIITPLWYLYALIGLYLMAPFFSRMTTSFNNRDYLVFLSLWCFFYGLIPEINALLVNIYKVRLKFVGYFQYSLFMSWAGYFLLGCYITKHKIIHFSKINIATVSGKMIAGIVAGVLSITVGVLSVAATNKARVIDNAGFIIIIILSALVFSWFIQQEGPYKRFIKENERFACIIKAISEATFGIYLSHFLIMNILLKKLSISPQLNMLMSSVMGVLFFDVVLYFICFIFIYVVRKIPIIRKIV